MQLLILSDLHANLSALEAVLKDIRGRYKSPYSFLFLGDYIDYGLRPNEVIQLLKELSGRESVIAFLAGNHEMALRDPSFRRFSSKRGEAFLTYTESILSNESSLFLDQLHLGPLVLEFSEKKYLFIHGSLTDHYWGSLQGDELQKPDYQNYDFVIGGHTHCPHLYEVYFKDEKSPFRGKRKVTFLNPGSIGQPRNHIPMAQYLYIETEKQLIQFNKVDYSIKDEVDLFPSHLDSFYRDRLWLGI